MYSVKGNDNFAIITRPIAPNFTKLQSSYSEYRQERTQILKFYLLAGCASFGVFGAQKGLKRASVKELVYWIFYYNQVLQLDSLFVNLETT